MHHHMLFKQAEGRTSSTFKCIHCDIHISNLLIDQYKALHSYVVLFESIHRWFHQLIHIPDITYFVNSPFQLSGWRQELILKIVIILFLSLHSEYFKLLACVLCPVFISLCNFYKGWSLKIPFLSAGNPFLFATARDWETLWTYW